MKVWICVCLSLLSIRGQETFPLESVSVDGTEHNRDIVLAIADLSIGAPINLPKIEEACQKLQDSGLFQSINYRYKPGPGKGYALTLIIGDQLNLVDAAIDIPGAQESELWAWLTTKFPLFDRKVPEAPAAHQFIARKLEEHLKDGFPNQPLVAELENNMQTGSLLVSFQPATLPRISTIHFTGNQAISKEELNQILAKTAQESGYIERHFRAALEMNVRRAYEDRAMYRVEFGPLQVQRNEQSVNVTVPITEGPEFMLAKAEFVGDDLPVVTLQKAADLKIGAPANWTRIEQGIWDAERALKRTGFFEATALPEKNFHDGNNTLDVRVTFNRGPLFRFSQLRLRGLSAAQEKQARKIWKLNPGDPFDYGYASDFLQAFFQTVKAEQFRKFDVQMFRDPEKPLMGFELIFVQ